VDRIERELQASEAKYTELQEEYARYRKEQKKAPASVLHADIAKLKVISDPKVKEGIKG